jgi:sporulation related protein/PilZ domain-containing protein
MVQERRLHQRLTPSSPQLVLLDESKYSLLFDLSEGGLAVEGFSIDDSNRAISLEFDMPEGSCCIQAKAEVAWTSDSGYRTGFRFVDLPDASRVQLRNWIMNTAGERVSLIESQVAVPAFASAASAATGHPLNLEGSRARTTQPELTSFPLQPPLKPRLGRSFGEQDEYDSDSGPMHLVSIFVAAVAMSCLAFLLGYYWHAGRPRPRAKSPVAVTQPFAPASASLTPSPAQPSAQTAIPPILPLDNPGFVLQVGAMGEEANADTLSNELRKKNFSAFVYHRDGDRFYRVAVGPYTDQGAAARIKSDLEQEGYKPILRPWTPQ